MTITEIAKKYDCSEQSARRRMNLAAIEPKKKKALDSVGRMKFQNDYTATEVKKVFEKKAKPKASGAGKSDGTMKIAEGY